ncbi:MAG: response regulator [Bacteroidota bacterium]
MNALIGKKVLIVDDNPMNQKLMQIYLKAQQMDSDIAENGQDAVAMLSEKSYDVILMDIQMPVLDGYEATKKIREDLRLVVPIIAMTASSEPDEYEKCLASGMNDYISKPFQPPALYGVLLKHLE